MASSCNRGGSGWLLGQISSQSSEAMARAARGGGGVAVSESVEGMCGCGTEDMVRIGWQLHWMIFVGLSSLNGCDSTDALRQESSSSWQTPEEHSHFCDPSPVLL